MENYLEYLEHLQGKMDFSDGVDGEKVALYFELRNVNRRLSKLFVVTLLILEPFLWIIGVNMNLVNRNIVPVLMVLSLVLLGYGLIRHGFDSVHYNNMVYLERDKIYFANYDIIRNEIVNGGEEQIRRLILWSDMCELTIANQKRYKELLRIVHSVCRNYNEIWK